MHLLPTQETYPMNATTNTPTSATAGAGSASGAATRYVVNVGDSQCEVRVRTIALISEVLGFEQEMDGDVTALEGNVSDSQTIADLLDSRMIAPPQWHRRRQRPVSSRDMFYGTTGQ
jgi:hypothetical protein